MTERVVRSGLSIRWEPNAPAAVMLSDDAGRTALAMRAHPDDENQRNVVLLWRGVEWASLGAPNEEVVPGHRLWHAGLNEVLWVGLVERSELIASLKKQSSVHPHHNPARYESLEHYLVPTKECLAEVVARSVEVHRLAGTTLESGAATLGSDGSSS